MNGSIEITKLQVAKNLYDERLKILEDKLKKYLDFPFIIEHQKGNGFMILNTGGKNSLAPLNKCLEMIDVRGDLPENYHDMLSR